MSSSIEPRWFEDDQVSDSGEAGARLRDAAGRETESLTGIDMINCGLASPGSGGRVESRDLQRGTDPDVPIP